MTILLTKLADKSENNLSLLLNFATALAGGPPSN